MARTKSDFMVAITQLSAEKNLPKEVVLAVVEAALASAYRKDSLAANQDISVKINPSSGEVKVYAQKAVAEKPEDPYREISLAEAQKLKQDVQIGDTIEVESIPRNAGRIAAQTARQVVLQRLREAEHNAIFEEFANKEGDVLSGVVQRIEPKQIFVDLGRTEAVLPDTEQVRTERYRLGQRIKVYLLEVLHTNKGPQLIVSRSHRNLVRRLFELEIPEVYSGAVELKAIAREAGNRTKVAVVARQQGIDPIGCCVGLRGIRVQNIISEINGEKIDMVLWDPNPAVFVANALSPAQVVKVEVGEQEKAASVVVPDRQLSLAIGKEGQNARLAARLTGWRIDIRSVSAAEAEKAKKAALEELAQSEAATVAPELAIPLEAMPSAALLETPQAVVEAKEAMPLPSEEAKPLPDVASVPQKPITKEIPWKPEEPLEKPQIRFAEELLIPKSVKPDTRAKKGKKKAVIRKDEPKRGGVISKKAPRARTHLITEDEEDEGY